MAEVGTLNLKIQSDTSEAEGSLTRLADALSRVKQSVQDAQLGNVASTLRRITKVINEEVNDTTISKLHELTTALERLKGLGTVNINLRNSERISKAAEAVDRALQGTQIDRQNGLSAGFESADASIQEVNSDLQGVGMTMQEINNIVHNTNWAAAFDPSKLPIGALGMKFGEASKEMYKYGDAVKETFDIVRQNSPTIQKIEESVTPKIEENRIDESQAENTGDAAAVYSSVEEAARALGISIEEVNRRLNETYSLVYGQQSGTPAFSSIEEAAKYMGISVEEAKAKIVDINNMTQGGSEYSLLDSVAEGVNRADAAIDHAQKRIQDLLRIFADSSPKVKQHIADMFGFDVSLFNSNAVNNVVDTVENAQEASAGMQAASDGLNNVSEASEQATEKLKETDKELKAKKSDADGAGSAFKKLGKTIKEMFPTLSKLMKQLKKIVIRRSITAMVRSIWSGAKEGIENVYKYSDAVGTSFAPAMDAAASSLLLMKNSLGAALAPILQALIPVLQTIVNLFIEAVNWVNQFIALLSGATSWTKAVPVTKKAFDDTAKAAKKAKSATQDLLADWDELNIIQSQSTGGSPYGNNNNNAVDYKDMFVQVDKFSKGLKDFTDTLKENIGNVKGAAISLAKIFLGWKVSRTFAKTLSTLSKLGTLTAAAGIIELTWEATAIIDKQYLKDGRAGWLVADVLENLVGDYFAGRMVASVLGSGVGAITMGLSMAISGGISYGIALAHPESDKDGALKAIGLVKGAIGTLITSAGFIAVEGELAAGIALGLGTAIPLFTAAAFIAYVAETDKTAHQIAADAFKNGSAGGVDVKTLYEEIQKEFDAATSGYNVVIDLFKDAPQLKADAGDAISKIERLNKIIKGGDKLTDDEAQAFKDAWEKAFSAFDQITKDSFSAGLEALSLSLTSANEEIRKQAKDLRVSALMLQDNLTQADAEFIAELEDLQTKVASGKIGPEDEEFKKYELYVEKMAFANDTLLSDMERLVSEGTKIDVSDASKVGEYITKNNESYNEAMEEIESGKTAGVEAWETISKKNEYLHDLEFITDEVYKQQKEAIDAAIKNITDNAEENKKRVEEAKQKSYQAIIGSVMEGLKLLPINKNTGAPNVAQVAAYMNDYVRPFIKAIEDAGGEVPEELKKAVENAITVDTYKIIPKNKKYTVKNAKTALREYVMDLLGLESSEPVEVDTPIPVEAPIELSPKDKIKELVEDKIDDGVLTEVEIQGILSFGYDDTAEHTLLNSVLEEMGLENSGEGYYYKVQIVIDPVEPELGMYEEYLSNEELEKIKENASVINKGSAIPEEEIDASVLFKDLDTAQNRKNIIDLLSGAMEDWHISDDEFTAMIDLGYDTEDIQNVLKDMGFEYYGDKGVYIPVYPDYDSEEWEQLFEHFNPTGRTLNPNNLMASAGISDVGYSGNGSGNYDLSDDMAKGVAEGNESQVNILDQLLTGVRQLLQKEFVVNVSPTADWGRHNQQSGRAYEKVTGEHE